MLQTIPLLLFALVIVATVIRGRSVRAQSGVSPWAFFEARGMPRVVGLIFALSFATLIVAMVQLALGRLQANPTAFLAGVAAIAVGTLVVVVAQRQMGAAWRVGVREGDAPLFVTRGLYRFSRNPIFLGMILMAFGGALATMAWWAWAALALFALACHLQVRIEEAHLTRQFDQEYAAFRAATPRWLVW